MKPKGSKPSKTKALKPAPPKPAPPKQHPSRPSNDYDPDDELKKAIEMSLKEKRSNQRSDFGRPTFGNNDDSFSRDDLELEKAIYESLQTKNLTKRNSSLQSKEKTTISPRFSSPISKGIIPQRDEDPDYFLAVQLSLETATQESLMKSSATNNDATFSNKGRSSQKTSSQVTSLPKSPHNNSSHAAPSQPSKKVVPPSPKVDITSNDQASLKVATKSVNKTTSTPATKTNPDRNQIASPKPKVEPKKPVNIPKAMSSNPSDYLLEDEVRQPIPQIKSNPTNAIIAEQDNEYNKALMEQKRKEEESKKKELNERINKQNEENQAQKKIKSLQNMIESLPQEPTVGIKVAVNVNGKRHVRVFSPTESAKQAYVWVCSLHFENEEKLFPEDFQLIMPLSGSIDQSKTFNEQNLPGQILVQIMLK